MDGGVSKQTPNGAWRVAIHLDSDKLDTVPLDNDDWPLAFGGLGLLESGEGVQYFDDAGDTGDTGAPVPFEWEEELMSTDHDIGTSGQYHSAMGSDQYMVDAVGFPKAPGSGTDQLVLFDPYLAAVCDL